MNNPTHAPGVNLRRFGFWTAVAGIAALYLFGLAASAVVPFGPPRSIGSVIHETATSKSLGHGIAWPHHLLGVAAGLLATLIFAAARRQTMRLLTAGTCLLLPLSAMAGGLKGAAEWIIAVPYAPFCTTAAILGLMDGEFYAEAGLSLAALGWWTILWCGLLVRVWCDAGRDHGRERPWPAAGQIVRATALLLSVVLSTASTLIAAPPEPAETGETADELFAWFDTLGYPDVSKARFVRIAMLGGLPPAGADPEADRDFEYGFLLHDGDASFRAFVIGSLNTCVYTKKVPPTPQDVHYSFTTADLKSYIDAEIAAYEHREKAGERDWRRPVRERIETRTEFIALAWVASRRGLSDPSARLVASVRRMPSRNESDKEPTLRGAITEDLAHVEIWNAVERFGDPTVTRTELLQQFRRYSENFCDPRLVRRGP